MSPTALSGEPDERSEPIPLTILTGFLGSGKTTVLNALLKNPEMANAAVLINEFGEIGIDHILVERLSEDVVLLNTGCICCSIRGDMVLSMRNLIAKRAAGDIPPFGRLFLETTGLADPAPIVHTLMSDPFIGQHYRLDSLVSTLDCVLGLAQLHRQDEALKQIALADRIVLTKGDLTDADTCAQLVAHVRTINPGAPILTADHGHVDVGKIVGAGLFQGKGASPNFRAWLNEAAYDDAGAGDHNRSGGHCVDGHDDTHTHRHGHHIRTFVMSVDFPLPWESLTSWLEMILATQGDRILRIKGILNVQGETRPIAIHGVQHVFHPPAPLARWPEADPRTSRLVFITRNLSRQAVEDTFHAFVRPQYDL